MSDTASSLPDADNATAKICPGCGSSSGCSGLTQDTGLTGSRVRVAGCAPPGVRRTWYQVAVSVAWPRTFTFSLPGGNVTAAATNVRSSAAAETLWKVALAGGAKVASVLPVTESPTT